MKHSPSLQKCLIIAIIALSPQMLNAQCETWLKLPNREDIQDSYVIYKSLMKDSDYEQAFSYWEYVYMNSPAADGLRTSVFSDGRTLYIERFNNETKRRKKKEIEKIILRLLEEEKICYPTKRINFTSRGIKIRKVLDFTLVIFYSNQ